MQEILKNLKGELQHKHNKEIVWDKAEVGATVVECLEADCDPVGRVLEHGTEPGSVTQSQSMGLDDGIPWKVLEPNLCQSQTEGKQWSSKDFHGKQNGIESSMESPMGLKWCGSGVGLEWV